MKRASAEERDKRTIRIVLFNLGALFVSRLLIGDYELELIHLRSPSYLVHFEFARPGTTSPTDELLRSYILSAQRSGRAEASSKTKLPGGVHPF